MLKQPLRKKKKQYKNKASEKVDVIEEAVYLC